MAQRVERRAERPVVHRVPHRCSAGCSATRHLALRLGGRHPALCQASLDRRAGDAEAPGQGGDVQRGWNRGGRRRRFGISHCSLYAGCGGQARRGGHNATAGRFPAHAGNGVASAGKNLCRPMCAAGVVSRHKPLILPVMTRIAGTAISIFYPFIFNGLREFVQSETPCL